MKSVEFWFINKTALQMAIIQRLQGIILYQNNRLQIKAECSGAGREMPAGVSLLNSDRIAVFRVYHKKRG